MNKDFSLQLINVYTTPSANTHILRVVQLQYELRRSKRREICEPRIWFCSSPPLFVTVELCCRSVPEYPLKYVSDDAVHQLTTAKHSCCAAQWTNERDHTHAGYFNKLVIKDFGTELQIPVSIGSQPAWISPTFCKVLVMQYTTD